MSDQFSRLLAPIAADLFFDRYWGREYLHVARTSREYYAAILPLAEIDAFLQSGQIAAGFINVVSNGELRPDEEWSRIADAARGTTRVAVPELLLGLYRNGSTLILNQAHRAIPSLAMTCRLLTRELGFPVRANVYVTPPNSQGFAPHSDDHEILILPLSGCKSFLIHPGSGGPLEVNLSAGDLLYLPRGLVHEARTHADPSIHVSMGLKPTYAFQLIEELASLARENSGFQHIVPPGRSSFDDEFVRRLQELVLAYPTETLAARRHRALVDSQNKDWPGRFSDVLRIADMTLDTILMARPGIITEIEEDGAKLYVHFAGNSLTVPKFLKPALDQVLNGSEFAIGAIRGMIPDQGKIDFVRPFVEKGLISIVKF